VTLHPKIFFWGKILQLGEGNKKALRHVQRLVFFFLGGGGKGNGPLLPHYEEKKT